MININALYEKEKEINSYFLKKYNYSQQPLFNQQVLELICETMELAYETKCFKYWRTNNSVDIEKTIKEYADCLMITLGFCDIANVDINKVKIPDGDDVVIHFIKIAKAASKIRPNLSENNLLEILGRLLKISILLEFTDEDIEKYCFSKMEYTLSMIKNDKF